MTKITKINKIISKSPKLSNTAQKLLENNRKCFKISRVFMDFTWISFATFVYPASNSNQLISVLQHHWATCSETKNTRKILVIHDVQPIPYKMP